MSILLSGELEVDGDLKVTGTIEGTIKNDSLAQVIAHLQAQITALQAQVTLLECLNSGNIPTGYCDCFGNVLDLCGVCGGDATSEDECYELVFDYDGNQYHVIQIGDQFWLRQNLNVDHYRNGDPITYINNQNGWLAGSEGKYTYYNYLDSLKGIYGNLYNFNAVVDGRGLCMEGFRVPTRQDWYTLLDSLGGDRNIAGGKLKETGYEHWYEPNTGATDEYDFKAIPAGQIGPTDGLSYSLGEYAIFWSSYEGGIGVHIEQLYNNSENLNSHWVSSDYGYSVRCIKDQ